ncbi:hypothetical protein PMAYCL1PPCAC_10104, partial [Pristionchus mayeri]
MYLLDTILRSLQDTLHNSLSGRSHFFHWLFLCPSSTLGRLLQLFLDCGRPRCSLPSRALTGRLVGREKRINWCLGSHSLASLAHLFLRSNLLLIHLHRILSYSILLIHRSPLSARSTSSL